VTASPPTTDHVAAARTAVGPSKGKWGTRLATATALYHLGQQGLTLYRNHQQNRSYSVTVPEGDEVYDLVQDWLLQMLPDIDQRALTARTHAVRGDQLAPMDDTSSKSAVIRRVRLSYDGTRSHDVDLDGHRVAVRVEQDENSQRPGTDSESRSSYLFKPRKIVFTSDSADGRQAVVRFLQGIADTLVEGKRTPRLVTASRWGHWGPRRLLPARPLDSVVLPAGHLDGVLADLRTFLDAEEKYALMGVPWHRGYLFHGPPGTGKTSAFRAIAAALGLDVYAVALSDLEADANLIELVGNVPERCMLLLEDIDVVHAAKARDDAERAGITLGGLLNALDGMSTPHGLITAMSTNNRAVLDDALLRPGRVDIELEMSYLTDEQFQRLVTRMTGLTAEMPNHGVWPTISPAEVVGTITANVGDMAAARWAAHDLLMVRWEQANQVPGVPSDHA